MSTTAKATLIKATTGLSLAAVLVVGCSSSKNAASAPTTAPSSPVVAAAPAAPASTPASPAAAAAASAAAPAASAATVATVAVKTGPLGAYLVDAAGRTLYLFTPDTTATSTCTGKCASAWPPLVTSGAPHSGSGADASLLGTSPRADGSTQVTYAGHPLYYFIGDKSIGATKGQGSEGVWWLLNATGAAIKTAATGVSAAPAAATKPTKAAPAAPAAPAAQPSASPTKAAGGWA